MDKQCHYTFGKLKEAVFKALGEYSVNGQRVSVSFGASADTENVFLQALNMCLRRVCLSFPLLAKTVQVPLAADASDGKAFLSLPKDFFAVHTVAVGAKTVTEGFVLRDGKLIFPEEQVGQRVTLVYAMLPPAFDENTPYDTLIALPDVTCDALIYLTAAELCPAEQAERYSRLVYGYRDLAYNLYNALPPKKGRNTFYTALAGFKKRFGTGR